MDDVTRFRGFIRESVGEHSPPARLAGDASTREYFRFLAGERSYILCHDENLHDSPIGEYPYMIVYALFRDHGIPVPEVYRVEKKSGLLLIQDMGDRLLEDEVESYSGDERKRIYKRLLDILIAVQGIPNDGSIPFRLSFDIEKLMFEFDFFIQHALGAFLGIHPNAPALAGLRTEFERIAALLDRPDLFVFNHRDYHSRNVMILEGAPYVIDFQDARLGLPQYDLVSLLRDPYARLDDALFLDLKDYYYEAARDRGVHSMSRDEFEYLFDLMGFQRNVKAIGTYGYQSSAKGKPLYERYIPPSLEYLKNYIARREELSRAGIILADCFGEAW